MLDLFVHDIHVYQACILDSNHKVYLRVYVCDTMQTHQLLVVLWNKHYSFKLRQVMLISLLNTQCCKLLYFKFNKQSNFV